MIMFENCRGIEDSQSADVRQPSLVPEIATIHRSQRPHNPTLGFTKPLQPRYAESVQHPTD
jgi:hypothetical protein